MLSRLDRILTVLGGFLRKYIYPFATPFFAVLNYLKMRQILKEDGRENWAKVFLIVSAIYFVFALGFGVYWLVRDIKNPS